MAIDYDFEANSHSQLGARTAVEKIFSDKVPKTVLDVGCGRGEWLSAFKQAGAEKCFGVDGLRASDSLVPEQHFLIQDLTQAFDLKETFDLVLCLEVAEHLDRQFSQLLLRTLTSHGDSILFSAAIPGQPGQHHVNCQWPDYWQALFNQLGYVCYDEPRWKIWEDTEVEPWYRQNMFFAQRNPAFAGREKRIPHIVHPDMLHDMHYLQLQQYQRRQETGQVKISQQLRTLCKALLCKFGARKAGQVG